MKAGRLPAIWIGWALLVGGCGLGPHARVDLPQHRLTYRPMAAAAEGLSVAGRRLRYWVYGDGDETVLVLAGVHGDEPAGTELAGRLRAYLAGREDVPVGRRVVVAPAVNPDGLSRKRRTNARGIDLNRNFATENWRRDKCGGPMAMSEPETRFIADLILCYHPARIVSIHQPLGCVDWDGPARDLARAMSSACGLPLKKLGHKPGSLGSYAGVERRIPTVTLELPKDASRLSGRAMWKRYGPAMLAAIDFSKAAK